MGYKKKDGTVITDEWMDALAEAAEKDRLPGAVLSTETHAGRPRMYGDDELKTISFRLPLSRISAIERAAKHKGKSRSDFLRDAVDKALTGDVLP
jgi:hypothetical protein